MRACLMPSNLWQFSTFSDLDNGNNGPPWLTFPCRFAHKRANRAPVIGLALHRHLCPSHRFPAAGPMTLSGGVSRVAKGADCKSAAVWLRRFESFFPHH